MEEKITIDQTNEYMEITAEKLDELLGEAEEIANISMKEINFIDKGGDETYGK